MKLFSSPLGTLAGSFRPAVPTLMWWGASVCQPFEQTDVGSVGEEVIKMETESAEQQELSEDFKQKVAKWEVARVFDRIARGVGMAARGLAGMGGGAKPTDSHN